MANPSATVSAGATRLGGTAGSFTVTDTGAASYEVPLRVVPGRGGFTPRLGLTYSSAGGDGHVGVGFSLSGLSTVTRCAKTVADDGVAEGVRLDESDRFCLNGRKLVAVSGVYGADDAEYRTKPDTHVRVDSYGGSTGTLVGPMRFVVRTPDGQQQEYGSAVKVRKYAGHAIVGWRINSTEDRDGNIIQYQYGRRVVSGSDETEEEGWLESITYGRFGPSIAPQW